MRRRRWQLTQKLEDGDLLRGEQEGEDGEDEAGIPKGVGEPVGVGDGGPGEGTDGGGGEDGALKEVERLFDYVNGQGKRRSRLWVIREGGGEG